MKLKIDIDEANYKNIVEQVNCGDYPDMNTGRAIANGVPTKDWVRPTGEWVRETSATFRCSVCNNRIPIKYDEVSLFNEGVAKIRKGKKVSFIDKDGKLIFQLRNK